MKCFTHPQTDAVARCSRCHKGFCTVCLYKSDQIPICFSCYERELHTAIDLARRNTLWVWIFTGGITVVAAMSSVGRPGTSVILVIPLAFILSWCLFWGWLPVWKRFTKMVGGCIIGPAVLISLLIILLAAIAILVGAGTGIQRYNDARALVANGDQMLATFRRTQVQRIRENQNGGAL